MSQKQEQQEQEQEQQKQEQEQQEQEQQKQEQQKQEQQEQEQQDEYSDEIMDKLKIDILNMNKKIKMYRSGARAPPLPPSVKGGVIGEPRSPTP